MKQSKNTTPIALELHKKPCSTNNITTQNNCLHCRKFTNTKAQFCCKGCSVAYKFLHELNLEKYYQQVREVFQTTPQSVEINNNYNYQEHVIKDENHNASITLHMPQIVCGACVWLIEKTLHKTFKNLSASVNFAHKSLNLKWNAKQLNFFDILQIINKIGYNAVPITVDAGYNKAKIQEKEMLKRVGISGLCTFFTMILSICIWAGHADGSMDSITQYIFHLISFLVVVPSVFYCADIFFIRAWNGLKNKRLDFNFTISLAIATTIAISIYTTFSNTYKIQHYAYFDSAISFIFILLIGKYMEMKVKNNAIYRCNPRHRLENNQYDVITNTNEHNRYDQNIRVCAKYPKQIAKDDLLLIKKGQAIPIDCILQSDYAHIDSAILSGESTAQNFANGQEIRAGSINLSSAIRVRAIRVYKESFLYKLQLEVESISCNSRSSKIANKLAILFTPIVLSCSIFTFFYWFYVKNSTLFDALYTTTTLLIITCPCAIGIAVPLASFAVISKLSNYGIIVKNSKALEAMNNTNTRNVVFDKTGTLTNTQLKVKIPKGMTKHDMNSLFTISSLSTHPFSRAISKALNGSKTLNYEDFHELIGQGVQAKINGQLYKFGSAQFVSTDEKESILFFKTPQQIYNIEYMDELREGAKELVSFFKNIGIDVWMISGDNALNVSKVASKLGISKERFIANATPQNKFEKCKRIGNYIMVGDGLNDSIALKSACVSISHFEGADFSKYNSDIVFEGNNLLKIKIIYKIAQKFRHVIWQNFCCSIIYNLIALPIAFLGYATPLKAAIFMCASSICVTFNALKLK